MSVQDFRRLEPGAAIGADVCIIGSGPAGWTLAEELCASSLQVLVLESGGVLESGEDRVEAAAEALNFTEDVGVPLFNGRRRTLGGTPEWLPWGNRCIPFDAIDYQPRDWVPRSGWPIDGPVVAPYLDRASRHLGAGPYLPSGPVEPPGVKLPAVDEAVLQPLWWWYGKGCGEPTVRFARRFRNHRHANLRVLTHATVSHINTTPSCGRVESVEVRDVGGRSATVRGRAFVLCCGGIENARVLLYSNRQVPGGLGNTHDLVGRFLMDHPRDLNMSISFAPEEISKISRLFGPCHVDSGDGRREYVAGFGLSSAVQRREGLLNCAAWSVVQSSESDPIWAAQRLLRRRSPDAARDIRFLAAGPGVLIEAARALALGRTVAHKADRLGLFIASEQRPDPDSRITLIPHLDALGLPTARTDWRIHADDRRSHAFLARTIRSEFERLGLPRARLADWIEEDRLQDALLSDGCHPTGVTRMAADPRDGVVDADCQVHGVDGLYVAGSSVFPTAGHANPTLMIVALATRLADRLKERLLSAPAVIAPAPAAEAAPPLGEPVATGRPPGSEPDAPILPGARVVVTGANGFIGGRLVETLAARGAVVTCLLRGRPNADLEKTGAISASGLDMADAGAVEAALEGSTHVFHCAYDWEDPDWNFGALRSLMACCTRGSGRRLVHVSSFVVYDIPADGDLVEESIPTTDSSGYADTKLKLEHELLDGVRLRDVAATIVQPTIVYGPRSKPWTVDPVEMLKYGTVVLPDAGGGVCNAVHVDDVVEGMIRASESGAALGQRFLISGEPTSWATFYEAMASAAGLRSPRYLPRERILAENRGRRKVLRALSDPLLLMRRLARRRRPRKLLDVMLAGVPRPLRERVSGQLVGPVNRQRGRLHMPDVQRLQFLEKCSSIPSAKARRVIAYQPRTSLKDGVEAMRDYLRTI